MQIDEIRAKAPEGATHYRELKDGTIGYFKELELLYLYAYWCQGGWHTLPYRYLDSSTIKPL